MTASVPVEERIRRVAMLLGVDAIGFGSAEPTERTAFVRTWWERGYGGRLDYVGNRLDERADLRRVLPNAKSVIAVGLLCPAPSRAESSKKSGSLPGPSRGEVARYAGGDDYHDVLLERIRAIEAALPEMLGETVRTKSYVDTGPVTERAAAEAAGLGWIGKNSMLIHPDLGSHLMLGVILCDAELRPDAQVTDHCGTCRACLDVCPTQAFAEPYVLDATKCLSYTTIETKGEIPEELRASQGEHVFGCDLCQTVCPWNRSRPKAWPADPLGLRTRLAKREEWERPTLTWLLTLDEETFRTASQKTAIRRAGRVGLIRNALVAAGNSGDRTLLPEIALHEDGDDPLLAEHARWARLQLEGLEEEGGCGDA